jgi:DMSO/TMAO reductase YedYZ molybdopterin-dependent catalytic subunit
VASVVGLISYAASKAKAEDNLGCSGPALPSAFADRPSFITDLSKIPSKTHHSPRSSFTIEGTKLTLQDLDRLPQIIYPALFHLRGDLSRGDRVANLKFKGVFLLSLLKKHQDPNRHLVLVEEFDEDGAVLFSTAIPLALLPKDTILVTEINDKVLSEARLFVPGWLGNFSVKSPQVIRTIPIDSVPTAAPYKELGLWGYAIAACTDLSGRVRVKDGNPHFDPRIPVGAIAIDPFSGWVWPTGGGKIKSVEISLDGGATWKQAEVHPNQFKYAWTFWKTSIPSPNSSLLLRATDSDGHVQQQGVSCLGRRNQERL